MSSKGLLRRKLWKGVTINVTNIGGGEKLKKEEIQKLLFALVSEECLVEYQVKKGRSNKTYVKVGVNASKVLDGEKSIKICS